MVSGSSKCFPGVAHFLLLSPLLVWRKTSPQDSCLGQKYQSGVSHLGGWGWSAWSVSMPRLRAQSTGQGSLTPPAPQCPHIKYTVALVVTGIHDEFQIPSAPQECMSQVTRSETLIEIYKVYFIEEMLMEESRLT